MYKHAASQKPASQEGPRRINARFAVQAFYLRPDNQGNNRLFRLFDAFPKYKDAVYYYNKRLQSKTNFLYVVLIRLEDMEAIQEVGDPTIEDNWLEYKAPGVPVGK